MFVIIHDIVQAHRGGVRLIEINSERVPYLLGHLGLDAPHLYRFQVCSDGGLEQCYV